MASGTHLITITATSSSKSEIKKDFNISLIVAHETPKTITINVPTQPLEFYGGENKSLQLSASVNPTQAEQKVKWTLGDDAPTGVSIDPNSGLLSTGTQLEYKENESSTHIEYT